MCVFCSATNTPICAIDGSCSTSIVQYIRAGALASTPLIGGLIVWFQSKFIKQKLKEKKK
jgi:hypothetical protein